MDGLDQTVFLPIGGLSSQKLAILSVAVAKKVYIYLRKRKLFVLGPCEKKFTFTFVSVNFLC